MRCQIAGIVIDIYHDFTNNNPFPESFSHRSPGKADVEVHYSACENINAPTGICIIDEHSKWYQNNDGRSSFTVFVYDADKTDKIVCSFEISDWNRVNARYVRNIENIEKIATRALMQVFFRYRIIMHEGVLLHASAILNDSWSVLFSAPSGTGKSTQALLWQKYYNAVVINDDAPAVKIVNNEAIVFGTPWAGKTEKFINTSAPVKAIVVLQQSPYNEIYRLDAPDINRLLLPRFLLPYYHQDLMGMAIDTVNKIVSTVPVYLLKCRREREAAELAYNAITG